MTKPTHERKEVFAPAAVIAAMLDGLLQFHGFQKIAFRAAFRAFAALPLETRQRLVNEELEREARKETVKK